MLADSLITKEVVEWVKALTANGLFTVDSQGRGDITPSVKEVLRALHEILSGGQAELVTRLNGCTSVKADLDQKFAAALASMGGEDTPDEYSP